MISTTEKTEQYISEHPSIMDCLKKEIINYSKLSRKIAKEVGIEKHSSMEAILIALRRLSNKLKKEEIHEDKIVKILRKSEMEIKNKIVVVIIDKKIYQEHLIKIEKKIRKTADTFIAIEGTNVFTLIISEKHLNEVKKVLGSHIIKITKDLAFITIKSPEDMESTHGIIAYLFSLMGDHGINIIEQMSCWTDSMIIVSEDDIPLAMKYLKFS